MDRFLTEEMRSLILDNNVQHLESSGDAILIFPDKFKLAPVHEYSHKLKFMQELLLLVKRQGISFAGFHQ